MKPRRAGADVAEQLGLGRGHPHLPVPFEPGEQSGAAARVEMRGDFVEQQDRRRPTAAGDELGVGQDDAEQQRLLLTGR